MRKTCILLLLFFVLNLMGCTAQPETNNPSESLPTEFTSPTEAPAQAVWYQNISLNYDTKWATPVVETDSAFYYIAEDGVYKYRKEAKEISKIVPETPFGLYLYEDNLCYNMEHEVKCVNLQTQNVSTIWDKTMLPDNNEPSTPRYISICDFALQDDYLYIAGTGTSVLRVNLTNFATDEFLVDCGSRALLGNDCYYTGHAQRTFSLYHMAGDSKKRTLLRGEGYSEPSVDKMRIDGVAVAGDTVAYSVRDTADIFLYNPDGNDEKIFDGDNSEEVRIFFVERCAVNKLYFYTTNGMQLALYEYQPTTGVTRVTSFGFTKPKCDIAITESTVFWWSEEESLVKCFALE